MSKDYDNNGMNVFDYNNNLEKTTPEAKAETEEVTAGVNTPAQAGADTGFVMYDKPKEENISSSHQPVEEAGNQAGDPVHHLNNSRSYAAYNVSEPVKTINPKKPKGKKKIWKRFAAIATSGILFGIIAGLTIHVTTSIMRTETAAETPIIPQVGVPDSGEITSSSTGNSDTAAGVRDVSNVVDEVMPSVVSITNMSVQETMGFFGNSQQIPSESSGSGIIVGQNESELLIATNNHVIKGAETLTVCFSDESTVEAKLKGTDSGNDLAVIAVKLSDLEQATVDSIKVAQLGDSSALKVGEPVIAIGNALGYGQSVTTGIVSAIDREVSLEDASGEVISNKLIQTDAAINPGNSGGALLNLKGEVIGINAAKVSSSTIEGMGYAIPISDASPILNDLMNQVTREKVSEENQGFLGIEGVDVTTEASQYYSMPAGVYVSNVTDGGAAKAAGLKKGDIIVKLDKTTIDSMANLKSNLEYYSAGEEVQLVIQRPNEEMEYTEEEITITLGKKTQ